MNKHTNYFERFVEIMMANPDKSHKECYELLENEWQKLVGSRRYKTYDSFRAAKCVYWDNSR